MPAVHVGSWQVVSVADETPWNDIEISTVKPKRMKRKPKLRNPFKGQVTRKVYNWGDSSAEGSIEEIRPTVAKLEDADLITSEVKNAAGIHKVVLDIDFPVVVLPSSTPGHHHLFIDKAMTWEKYRDLIEAFVDAGIVEPGYMGASEQRGFTGVRPPWVKKQ